MKILKRLLLCILGSNPFFFEGIHILNTEGLSTVLRKMEEKHLSTDPIFIKMNTDEFTVDLKNLTPGKTLFSQSVQIEGVAPDTTVSEFISLAKDALTKAIASKDSLIVHDFDISLFH